MSDNSNNTNNTNNTNNKRIAKNTLFLYIRMLFVLVVNLYTSRVILRTLGMMDYGVYNVVAGFVSMFSFLNTSMANGIQRYFNYKIGIKEEGGVGKVYVTALTIQALLALIIFIILETFGIWYLNNVIDVPPDRVLSAKFLFQFSLISLLIMLMQIPFASAIMAYEKMDYYAVVGIVDVLLKLGIVFLLPVLGHDRLIVYGLLLVVVSLVDFGLYFFYAKFKFSELKFKRSFYGDLFKSMLGFSGWNILGTFAFMMKGQGLNMLLNAFFGPIVNAARGIAAQIMNALQGFSANIVVAFRPQLTQSYATRDYNRVRVIFYSESKISYIFLLALVTPVVLEIEFILNMWLGADMVPDYTIPFTILVLANMLISAFHSPMTQIVHASGQMKVFQIVVSCIICSIIPVSLLFLKLGYGPSSVFVVSLIITAINLVASLMVVHTILPFRYRDYIRKVLLPCGLLTLLVPILPLIVFWLLPSSIWRVLLVCMMDIVCVIVFGYLLALEPAEKIVIQSFVRKLTNR